MMKRISLVLLFFISTTFTMEPEYDIPSAAILENPYFLSAQLPFEIRERLYKFAYPLTAFYWAVQTQAFYNNDPQHPFPTICLVGHEIDAGAKDATFSPNNQWIATASSDDTARIWDVQSGQTVRVLKGHSDAVLSVQFSPDSRYIVTGSGDETARIWDVQSGQTMHILTGHSSSIMSARFSPNGLFVVTASHDMTARVWDIQTGKTILTLNHRDFVNHAEYSRNGKYILTTTAFSDQICIWNAEDGDLMRTIKVTARSASFSPDSQFVLTNIGDIFDIQTGNEVFSLRKRGKAWIETAEFSPNGQFIITSDSNHFISIWDAKTYKQLFSVESKKETFVSTMVRLNYSGQYIVTLRFFNNPCIWKLYNPKVLHYLQHNVTSEQAKLLYEIQQAAQENQKLDLRNRPGAVEILMSIAPYVREMLLQHVVIEELE